ncbi:MAG: nickel pincer cofactor biosynthesis protein LarC [Desulfobia sp.]
MIGYCDPFSGISGDMFLGALLDNGLSENKLKKQLSGLKLTGYSLASHDVLINGIRAKKVEIIPYGEQPQRNWPEIRSLIENSSLPENVREKALSVFTGLARAEATIHGCQLNDVHFHEVGAIDSIIDIVAAVIGLNLLGISRIYCGPLPMSSGWTKCSHGPLPLPAPAVCQLIKDIPVYGTDCQEELVTPTGAALIKTLACGFGPIPQMTVHSTGYGAGSRERRDGYPNLFRLIVGKEYPHAEEAGEVEVMETHLDDWQPETFPWLSEQLFQAGALDVALIPIQMKKGRPGFLLRVIGEESRSWHLKQIITSETTTIGLRYRREKRWTLPRQKGYIDSRWGPLAVKRVETTNGSRLYPEYESCCATARRERITLQEVYAKVAATPPEEFQSTE